MQTSIVNTFNIFVSYTSILAPDQFASSDVCVSGCCRGMLARCHGFSRGCGREDMRRHVFDELVLSFCRKQTCFRLMIHNGNKIDL